MDVRGTIVVDSQSWHRRVYAWWARRIADDPPETVNLCLYMRVVLIYVPVYCLAVAFAVTIGTLALIATSPLWVPFFVCWLLFDGARRRIDRVLEHFADIAVAVLVTCVVVLIGVLLVASALQAWHQPLVFIAVTGGLFVFMGGLAVFLEHRKHKNEIGDRPGDGIASLSWSWLRAKKHRICPLIETRQAKP